MLRPILLHPNPKLKKVCEPVVKIDDAIINVGKPGIIAKRLRDIYIEESRKRAI